MIENKLTVGEIAQKFGVSTRTIRHYETVGLISSERDRDSNYRLYGSTEHNRIEQIMLLKSMGFTLKEISSVITSSGNKKAIINIINNRLDTLAKKSLIYSQCVDLLKEFLAACNMQDDDNIDSLRLLNELMTGKSKDEIIQIPEDNKRIEEKSNYLKEDHDLDILDSCLAEDFNPLYLPFITGQEDGDLLENYFVNHRRFWGFRHLELTDGTNLNDIYSPAAFRSIITGKITELIWNTELNQAKEHLSYKQIVISLCSTIIGLDYDSNDSLPVLERKLTASVFAKALEMLELAGELNCANLQAISEAIGIKSSSYEKHQILESVDSIVQAGGMCAYSLARQVNNAIKRNRYSGPFYVLTDSSAFKSDDWKLDRALDMAVGFLWTHEIHPAGQPYHTLFPVVFQIACMRSRILYASAPDMQPDIVNLDEFMIIGLELITTDKDGESFRKVPEFEETEYIAKRVCDHIPNRVNPGIRYGMATRRNGEYFSYIAGEQVSSLEYVPDGMTGEAVPSGTYAVFYVNGGPLPFKVIETIQYAYQNWLPASGYQWVNRPGFNLFVNATGRADADIRIYVPVEKKETI